ncbi:MAG: hypothetical protein ACFBSC_19690 [Microcoleaceae cyanobacterium]
MCIKSWVNSIKTSFQSLSRRLFSGQNLSSKEPTQSASPAINPLSDSGYESLFLKVLDGIDQGWSQEQVLEFLGERYEDRFFRSWLKRFGQKRLDSPLPQTELARRMIRLGEIDSGELGRISAEQGQNLQQKQSRPLSDEEFQVVFQRLLNGVSLGWGATEIDRFFQELGEQGRPMVWQNWFNRFQAQELSADRPNYDLIPGLRFLGEQLMALPRWQEFANSCHQFSQKLSQRQENESIWEYDGADTV